MFWSFRKNATHLHRQHDGTQTYSAINSQTQADLKIDSRDRVVAWGMKLPLPHGLSTNQSRLQGWICTSIQKGIFGKKWWITWKCATWKSVSLDLQVECVVYIVEEEPPLPSQKRPIHCSKGPSCVCPRSWTVMWYFDIVMLEKHNHWYPMRNQQTWNAINLHHRPQTPMLSRQRGDIEREHDKQIGDNNLKAMIGLEYYRKS